MVSYQHLYRPRVVEPVPALRPVARWRAPRIVVLPDGGVLLVRAARSDDAERLRRMFYRLSSDTRYRWFFAGVPQVPHWAERVAALATSDDPASGMLVALSGGEVVGFARYDLDASAPERTVEVSMLIEDAWQSRGLGSRLARALRTEAHRRDMTSITARILSENRRAVRLAVKTLPGAKVTWASGEVDVCARLLPPDA